MASLRRGGRWTRDHRRALLGACLALVACQDSVAAPRAPDFAPVRAALTIDPEQLPNYANVTLPYFYYDWVINRDDREPLSNPLTDAGATLGRVLFFDRELSRTRTIRCASCHEQSLGFADTATFSVGHAGGVTGFHSMRLTNARFNQSGEYFWTRRAPTLEAQTTDPIRDGLEHGFDEANGGIDALLQRMRGLPYYPPLFWLAFGDSSITEARIQRALAQYLRSIVSTTSRFDLALAQVPPLPGNGIPLTANLPGFTEQELRGRDLFLSAPATGGAGCGSCHLPPTFSMAAASGSNGLDAGETRTFRAPSLKHMPDGSRFMHDGRFATLEEVVEFYDSGVQFGPALDSRLRAAPGEPVRLNLSAADRAALVAFLRTLVDNGLASDPRFSDPFRP